MATLTKSTQNNVLSMVVRLCFGEVDKMVLQRKVKSFSSLKCVNELPFKCALTPGFLQHNTIFICNQSAFWIKCVCGSVCSWVAWE